MKRDAAGTEPVGNFAHMLLAVGIVDVLARSKDLDRLRAAAHQPIQQAGMQPLFDVNKVEIALSMMGSVLLARIYAESSQVRTLTICRALNSHNLETQLLFHYSLVAGPQAFPGFQIDHDALAVAPVVTLRFDLMTLPFERPALFGGKSCLDMNCPAATDDGSAVR